ncbi:MAG: glutamyl-tRNA reductase [Nitrososphaerota archaeon]|nr:glutamyl-tRNA reductase [Nitrososphaerota archaeon]MDG6962777.1 glutamyl-tRNA reductase [Nitrososphaerota archaeon]MDG6986295.1 glutamyl-tRNA reductase [Nitrososphaerota archaeon]MDG6992387.1 glutamyl-tRNA reductase [Nitrososphaerota archaeon]MDG7003372.1 glutamyl-tRNA reductase [Nitrososphaerota archaeon]
MPNAGQQGILGPTAPPSDGGSTQPQLLLVGTSYQTSGVSFREALAKRVEAGRLDRTLAAADESALLSTCNRYELYLVSKEPDAASAGLVSYLRGLTGHDRVGSEFYQLKGQEAVRHLFRVASGLESVVVGEPQILAQVRAAGVESRVKGEAKGILSPLFDRAYRVGNRVRSSYGLGSDEASLSDLAMEAIDRVHPERKVVMLVGTGKMIRLAARRLKGNVSRLYVASRRKRSPAGLEWCRLVRYADVKRLAKSCDVLISATSVKKPIITSADLKGRRPKTVVDLGMPRNVSDAVRGLPNVRLLDLDDLAAMATARRPPAGLAEAEVAVSKEASEFYSWLVQTRLSTTVADIYSWAEGVREEELRRAVSRLGPASARDKRIVEAMGRRIVSKLIARPVGFARKKHPGLSEEEKLGLLRAVFGGDSGEG